MNFEDFAKEYWKGDLHSYVQEALTFYEMNSHIEREGASAHDVHLYLDSIVEENMLSRLVESVTEYEDIEAAFGGRVIREY
ncbi:hypothetical protein EQV77_14820 [Halobacillus fulvus]|nr:hypothetical protein EQV77_14820 [Halobacillus fulvus]